jgi:Holliday junction DNA helicase RuvA
MISYISGKVLKIWTGKDCFVDILTASGIGYRVYITKKTNILSGENISLYTYFHVREDAQTLYGFLTEGERDFFEKLISVSGVGPKLGLSILSTYSKEEVEELVVEGNDSQLSKTPGLGSKGAQKIILELRGKIDFKKEVQEETSELKELKMALKSLGFTGEALNSELERGSSILEKEKDIDIETLIKKVLAQE